MYYTVRTLTCSTTHTCIHTFTQNYIHSSTQLHTFYIHVHLNTNTHTSTLTHNPHIINIYFHMHAMYIYRERKKRSDTHGKKLMQGLPSGRWCTTKGGARWSSDGGWGGYRRSREEEDAPGRWCLTPMAPQKEEQ